jgi:hypothetical protein
VPTLPCQPFALVHTLRLYDIANVAGVAAAGMYA